MRRLGVLALIAHLCAFLSGCILLDAADLGYMATHHGRHIDEAPVSASGGDMAAGSIGGMLGGMGPSGGKKNANAGPTNIGGLLGGMGPSGGKKTGSAAADTVGGLLGGQAPAPSTVGGFMGDQMRPVGAGTNALLGPATPGAPGDVAPTITRTSTQPIVGPNPTYDNTGRPLTDGPVSSVPNASLGQKVGLFAGLAPFGIGALNAVPDRVDALTGDDTTGGAGTGGMIGRGIDALTGQRPGRVEGQVGNRVASSGNARGARPSDDSRIMDRAGAAATAALLGDGPDSGAAGTDALFSDVQLADRRKRSDFAGTNMLLKAAA